MDTVFDAHVHFRMQAGSPADDLLAQLRRGGVRAANLILNSVEEKAYFKSAHSRLAAAGIDFVYSMIPDPDMIRFMSDNRLPWNMKIHPRLQNWSVADMPRIVSLVRETRPRTIIVDCWPDDWHDRGQDGVGIAAALAEECPECRVVLAHGGGIFLRETLFLTRKRRNVFYDTALTANYFFDSAMREDFAYALRFFGDRIMFGSDYPDFSTADAVKVHDRILELVRADEVLRKKIYFSNAERILMRDR